jgi:hypothetical protein
MSNRFPADDEHLHPYPGNLKHHKVDKEEQRKLLCEMMKDDAKSGLYNEKKREPLLSDGKVHSIVDKWQTMEDTEWDCACNAVSEAIELHEAARAKDAELIQQLVDEVAAWMQPNLDERFRGEQWHQSKRILDAASAAGFKPTYP